MGESPKEYACPKCGRMLAASGEILMEDSAGGSQKFLTYQCDGCTRTVALFDTPVEAALTFAVDGSGNVFDPADPKRGPLKL